MVDAKARPNIGGGQRSEIVDSAPISATNLRHQPLGACMAPGPPDLSRPRELVVPLLTSTRLRKFPSASVASHRRQPATKTDLPGAKRQEPSSKFASRGFTIYEVIQ